MSMLGAHINLTAYGMSLSLRAALAQLLATARDSLLYGAHPPRPGDSSVSAAWLEKQLRIRQDLSDGARVKAVRVAPLADNRGLASCILAIEAELDTGDGTPVTVLHMVLKMSHRGMQGRKTVLCGGRVREGLFYGMVMAGGKFRGMVLPRIYYSHGSEMLGEYVILMEDLRHKGGVGVNMIMGNQIWGVPDMLRNLPDPVAVLNQAFTQAALLHAAYWNDAAILKKQWLKGAAWYAGRDRWSWESGIRRAKRSWARTKAAVSNGSLAVKMDQGLAAMMDASLEATSWQALQEHLRSPRTPFTLCHGDFHAANMIFLKDNGASTSPLSTSTSSGGELFAVDWSEVGPWEGTTDLAQMVISDVKPSVFEPHASALVRAYWQALVAEGVSKESYSFGDCWEAFCRGGMERWLWLFAVISALPNIPHSAVQYFHDQLLAFSRAFGNGRTCYALKPVVCIP
ncbi:hypothetical protein JKP88DRAFT_334990 [Tribonema minus]|uniref:Aminoglycoside phosphotransferase domain-containing protein n=1 Tax=Tribonema minus TaxID=303371 RepID=A0A835YMN7_9STRA|nr:hypothetical protein JKP88DRAFT_334990 [Tribonema minus]